MPTGLTPTEEQMRAWREELSAPAAPNDHLRLLMSFTPTRTDMVNFTRDTVTYRATHGFQVHRSEGVVVMSNPDSVSSWWDGHEPEDL